MATRDVAIASSVGLHARPAKLFVTAVTESGIPVKITKAGGRTVDAKSMLGVMSLGAKCGDVVTLEAEGDDAERVLDELVALLAIDHDAPEAQA